VKNIALRRSAHLLCMLLAIWPALSFAAADGLTISPHALFFGREMVGSTSATQTVQIRAYFGVRLSAITTTGDFTQTNNCGGQLQMFGTCQIMVTFGPTAVGPRSGVLSIVSDASAMTVQLSGIGTPAPSPTMSPTPTPSPTATPTATPTPGTALLFPFVVNQSYDTGLTLSNTTANPFGTTPQSSTCTIYWYGVNAPSSPTTTPTINAGTTYALLASTTVPGFQGYAIAVCGFNLGEGIEAPTAGETSLDSLSAKVLRLTGTPPTVTRLLFPFVVNLDGVDTGLTISNTTANPFGTAAQSGTCTINFYGTSAPSSPFTTPTINAGATYTTAASTIAPGFQGYAIATCNFGLGEGIQDLISSGKLPGSYISAKVLPLQTPLGQ
jgi:hypothetical protein